MEPTTTPTPTTPIPSSPGDDHGVCADVLTKLPPDPSHSSDEDDDFDFRHKQDTLVPIGYESNEAIETKNGSRSVDKNQSRETVDVVRSSKDSQTEPDSLDDDVEIVIKNQHKYYFYCPCCGEDITKTVKLVKKSDPQPIKNNDPKNEATVTENGSRSKDKKTKFPSWFPVYLQNLFLSVYGHYKDKDKKGVDSKSPGSYNDLGINGEEPSIHIRTENDRRSFPKWILDIFAWLFLCIVIALSVLFNFPQQSLPVLSTSPLPFIPQDLQLPSISTLQLSSASVLLLLPAFAVLLLVIMALRFPRYNKEKGDTRVDSKSTDVASEEQNDKTQCQDDQGAVPDQDSEKKTDNQKVHPTPVDPTPENQPSQQIASKETHENAECANTQAEPELQSDTRPDISKSVETKKGGNKLEILKSIVYGGLTQSITSLCTVTSAAASGASTVNVLALGVANLSSGLLLIVHSLQELINEKPKRRTNADGKEEEGEDRYEETLGRRDKWKLHKVIAVSSFVIFGLIPPLVYGYSFRRRMEKRQEYKTLAVYAASLACIVLLSIAKAHVSKRREYLKTLFRYTTMATTASGFSQFVGYMVTQWLEKSGFYDDSPETPRV